MLPDDVLQRLKIYHALLVKWQKAINLVSPKTMEDAWQRHFADSLQIADLVPRETVVADLGSGAGFPAMVLAIARPDLKVHLIESDERKGQFLKNVSRETETAATIHTGRVENVLQTIFCDVITARAFAPLESILEYVLPSAEKNHNLILILMKGRDAAQEIDRAQKAYKFNIESIPSTTESGACILVIKNLCKKI